MTITLELRPDLEKRLVAEATARGESLESYLLAVLEQSAHASTSDEMTQEESEAVLDAFSEGTESLPVLPPEAFSRESIYSNRGGGRSGS